MHRPPPFPLRFILIGLVALVASSASWAAAPPGVTVVYTVDGIYENGWPKEFYSLSDAEAALRGLGPDHAFLQFERIERSDDWTEVYLYTIPDEEAQTGPWDEYFVDDTPPAQYLCIGLTAAGPFPTEAAVVDHATELLQDDYCTFSMSPGNQWEDHESGATWTTQTKYYVADVTSPLGSCHVSSDFNVCFERRADIFCPSGPPYNGSLPQSGLCKNSLKGRIKSEPLSCPGPGNDANDSNLPWVGNPCSVSTGDKWETESDYTGAGLKLTRHYHSLVATSGDKSFGSGWTHSYSSRLSIYGNVPAAYLAANGMVQGLKSMGYDPLWRKHVISYTGSGVRVHQINFEWVLITDSNRREVFDSTGRLLRVIEPNGQVTTLNYDADGLLETVVGPFGHTLTFGRDETTGRVDQVTDPSGNDILYAYDALGNLTQVTYQDGTTRVYHYEDPAHQRHLTGITDENGDRYSTFAYDEYGRATLTEHAGGYERFTLQFNADESTTVTNAVGNTSTYQFTGGVRYRKLTGRTRGGQTRGWNYESPYTSFQRRVETRTNERGVVTKYVYTQDHLTSRTDAFGTPEARTTTYEYLSFEHDLPTLVRTPSVHAGNNREVEISYNAAELAETVTVRGYTPAGVAVQRVTGFTYNAKGQVTQFDGLRTDVTDITTFEYYECTTGNQCGQLRKVINALGHETIYDEYDAHGRIKKMTDPNGLVTEYTYDLRGQVESITRIPPSGPARVTTYTHDDAGQIETVTMPNGTTLTYAYDAAHLLRSITDNLGNEIAYDYYLDGKQKDEKTYDPQGVLTRTLSYTYDARGRIDTINSAGSITDLLFDAVGDLTSESDPNGSPTTHNYDPLDRLEKTIDALSGQTEYDYDVNDQLVSVQTPNGAITTYEYDDLGNLLKLTSPDSGVTTYTYDEAGNRLSQTDARGITTTYTYDALNRLASISYPDSTLDVTLTYDSGTAQKGRLTAMADGSSSTTFSYDVFGNLIREDRTIDSVAGSVIYVTQYEYDAANNLSAMVYPSGRRVDYTRNVLGQVTAVDTTYDGNSQNVGSNIGYRPFGPIESLTHGNGLVMSRSYDQAYRIDNLATSGVQSRDYTLDPAGNITRITDLIDATQTQSFGYDALHRLTSESGAYGDKTYVYDEVGNRETRTFDDGQQITTQTLTYVANSNRLATHDGTTVVIDAAGNTTDDGQGTTFTYGDHNRVTAADVGGSQVASYAYNTMGQQVRKTLTTGSQETTILHFGFQGEIFGETVYDSAGTKTIEREIIWLEGLPLAQEEREYDSQGQATASQFVYLHADHLNTPRLATDSSGTIAWRWPSDGFGVGDADTDPDGDGTPTRIELKFPGQHYDQEAGLHYNYFRYYDLATGRYLTSDPIGLDGGLNTYMYAESNPVRYVDPRGLHPIPNTGLHPGGPRWHTNCVGGHRHFQDIHGVWRAETCDNSQSFFEYDWTENRRKGCNDYVSCTAKCVAKLAIGEAFTQHLENRVKQTAKALALEAVEKFARAAGVASTLYTAHGVIECTVNCAYR